MDIVIDDPVQAIRAEIASGRKLRVLNKQPMVFDVPLNMYPYQPWARHPNPSAWFNYGFRAETWTAYCETQKQIRDAIQNLGLATSSANGASRNVSNSE